MKTNISSLNIYTLLTISAVLLSTYITLGGEGPY